MNELVAEVHGPETEGSETRPFGIHLHRLDRKGVSHFRPAASLHLTPVLRTSGILKHLPAEDLKNLLYLLTFLSPNGICQPSIHELSQAMGVSALKVRCRMKRLMAIEWQGQPLVRELERPAGLAGYAVSERLFAVTEWQPRCPHCGTTAFVESAVPSAPIAVPVTADSPAQPSVALESQLQSATKAMANAAEASTTGPSTVPQPLPLTPAERRRLEAELRGRLINYGVSDYQAEYLLSEFPPDRIARQIVWLPYRKARNPAALIVRAIELDYAAPLGLPSVPDLRQEER